MAVNLSPIGNDAPFVDSSGNPLSGGLLYTYTAGSSTPENTYTTSAGSVANANPVVLDSGGYPATGGSVVEIWLTPGVSYKFVLKTSAGVTVWTRDNIDGINDTSVSVDQWMSGPAPTYVSATQFTLVGDQTSTFHVGRRVKTTNSGGTVYGTITVSAYTTLTTITVVNDSGTLDAGLSAVSYGLISAVNTSDVVLGRITASGQIIVGTAQGSIVAVSSPLGGAQIINGKIALSVGASALTAALKGLDGNDPSATNPVFIRIPQNTAGVFDGTYAIRKVTAALSVVVSSGSTLGHTSAVACPVYFYLIDNAGAPELAVSTKFFGTPAVVSTTAEGGAGAADTATTMYSTTARSNVSACVIGRWKSTQTTAGTWAAVTGEQQLYPFPFKTPKVTVYTNTGANTFTRDWDSLWLRVRGQAAGGGGGGATATGAGTYSSASGGGGGEYREGILAAASITATVTATVGAGGTVSSGGSGGTGGTTSFGSYISAVGGAGGTTMSPLSSDTFSGAAVAGGTGGSGGDFGKPGGNGGIGFVSASSTATYGGIGGDSQLAGLKIMGTGAQAGGTGNTYGGGGAGGTAANGSGATTGGVGGAGIIIVEEHYQ